MTNQKFEELLNKLKLLTHISQYKNAYEYQE
jgi:hypothetical protein